MGTDQRAYDSFEARLSRVFGFYDFAGPPTVLFPQTTGNEHPWFTALHEQTHDVLARSSTYGFMQRLVASVLGEPTLTHHDRERFRHVFKTLLRPSFNVYEGFGTYGPFKSQGLRYPSELRQVWARLPEAYRSAAGIFERVLSPLLLQPGAESDTADGFIAQSIATSALSSPILVECEALESLARLEEIVKVGSPDHRLAQIVDSIERNGSIVKWRDRLDEIQRRHFGRPLDRLVQVSPREALLDISLDALRHVAVETSDYVEGEIAALLPELVFVRKDSLRSMQAQRIIQSWQKGFAQCGKSYLQNVTYEIQTGGESAQLLERMADVRVAAADEDVNTLKDNSWLLRYRQFDLAAIRSAARQYATHPDCLLIGTIYVNTEAEPMPAFKDRRLAQGDCMLMMLPVPAGKLPNDITAPFGTTCSTSELRQVCHELRDTNVVWKIDGRILNRIDSTMLHAELPSPLFVIEANETVSGVSRRIEELRETHGSVTCVLQKIGGKTPTDGAATGVVMLFGSARHRVYMARIADVNWNLLKLQFHRHHGIVM